MPSRALVAVDSGTSWIVGFDVDLVFSGFNSILFLDPVNLTDVYVTSLTLTETIATIATHQPWDTLPQNSKSADYTTVLSDAGKQIIHPASDNNPRTFTIDSNANVAYPIGTCITFINMINTVTIAITSDTLTMAGSGLTGSRTLAANGIATAVKIGTTSWLISGTGLT